MDLDIFSPLGNDTRQLLDWNLIISSLGNNAHFELNQQVLLNSFLSIDQSLKSINNIDQLITYPDTVLLSIKNALTSIDPSIESGQRFLLLEKFSIPSPATLNYCAHLIVTYSTAKRLINSHSFFKDSCLDEKNLLKIVQEVRFFIDPNGSLNFEKHPLLKSQSEKVNNLSKQIRDRIQFLIKDDLYRNALAYDQYDIFDDRYVVPIRADNYRYEHGIIISRSQSGQTLLVEPIELRELSNKRLRELSYLDELINKLCLDTGAQISKNFKDCLVVYNLIHDLDLLICKTIFSIEKELTRPDFDESKDLVLEDFFHPLLAKPIKNTVVLPDDKKGFLLSGPNTGGKTVALKSICLCFMFFRLGLFLPARRAHLPRFNQVFFFSHDQQSLEKGLSSFSSESERYLSIIDNLKDHSFLFIDEIFNSTSSEEASALALGFMDYIASRTNSNLFISSHHHRLKAIIHQRDEYLSAHVGFDEQTQLPTYKLHIGSPGPSMAITIFKNFSKKYSHSSSIAQRSEAYLDNSYINYEQLLEKLNLQKEELLSKGFHLDQLVKEAAHAKSSAEGIIHLEKQKIISAFEKEISKKISVADDLINRLKYNPVESSKSYFSEIRELKKYIAPTKPERSSTEFLHPAINIGSIVINASYFHIELGQNVQVLDLNLRKSKVLVLAGTLKIWTEAEKLTIANTSLKNKKIPIRPVFLRESTSTLNFDARGYRLDEFQRLVDQAISDLFSDDLPYIEIIHGHGDGTLKNWLRKYLNNQSDIEWSTPEGNDGSTIIKIK